MIPGQIMVGDAPLDMGGDPDLVIIVSNTADRPVQVGSHFHFAEANAALAFDRTTAWGRRLAIPAGTSVRFEPGIEREVGLTPLRGARRVPGLRGVAGGALDPTPPTGPTA
ncbi:MAG: urease subunit beta [Acidimicrobiales bacterium]|jgi:urease subunit beta